MSRTHSSYADYWDAYLEAHSKPGTRALHYVATCLGLGFGLFGLATLSWPAIGVGVVGGYAIAFSGHFLVERNKPLANRPVWGAISDLRMFFLALTGRLGTQLSRHRPRSHRTPQSGPEHA